MRIKHSKYVEESKRMKAAGDGGEKAGRRPGWNRQDACHSVDQINLSTCKYESPVPRSPVVAMLSNSIQGTPSREDILGMQSSTHLQDLSEMWDGAIDEDAISISNVQYCNNDSPTQRVSRTPLKSSGNINQYLSNFFEPPECAENGEEVKFVSISKAKYSAVLCEHEPKPVVITAREPKRDEILEEVERMFDTELAEVQNAVISKDALKQPKATTRRKTHGGKKKHDRAIEAKDDPVVDHSKKNVDSGTTTTATDPCESAPTDLPIMPIISDKHPDVPFSPTNASSGHVESMYDLPKDFEPLMVSTPVNSRTDMNTELFQCSDSFDLDETFSGSNWQDGLQSVLHPEIESLMPGAKTDKFISMRQAKMVHKRKRIKAAKEEDATKWNGNNLGAYTTYRPSFVSKELYTEMDYFWDGSRVFKNNTVDYVPPDKVGEDEFKLNLKLAADGSEIDPTIDPPKASIERPKTKFSTTCARKVCTRNMRYLKTNSPSAPSPFKSRFTAPKSPPAVHIPDFSEMAMLLETYSHDEGMEKNVDHKASRSSTAPPPSVRSSMAGGDEHGDRRRSSGIRPTPRVVVSGFADITVMPDDYSIPLPPAVVETFTREVDLEKDIGRSSMGGFPDDDLKLIRQITPDLQTIEEGGDSDVDTGSVSFQPKRIEKRITMDPLRISWNLPDCSELNLVKVFNNMDVDEDPRSLIHTHTMFRLFYSIRCQMCYTYTYEMRCLQCFHVFCEKCIEKTIKNHLHINRPVGRGLECPKCKLPTQLDEFSTHRAHHLDVMAQKLYALMIMPKFLCVNHKPCGKEHYPATLHCIQCNAFYCEDCFADHVRQYKFQEHKYFYLGDRIPFRQSFNSVDVYCKYHKEQLVSNFCENCRVAGCHKCRKRHPLHVLVRITKDKGNYLRTSVDNFLKNERTFVGALKYLKEMEDKMEFVKTYYATMDRRSSAIYHDATKYFEKVRSCGRRGQYWSRKDMKKCVELRAKMKTVLIGLKTICSVANDFEMIRFSNWTDEESFLRLEWRALRPYTYDRIAVVRRSGFPYIFLPKIDALNPRLFKTVDAIPGKNIDCVVSAKDATICVSWSRDPGVPSSFYVSSANVDAKLFWIRALLKYPKLYRLAFVATSHHIPQRLVILERNNLKRDEEDEFPEYDGYEYEGDDATFNDYISAFYSKKEFYRRPHPVMIVEKDTSLRHGLITEEHYFNKVKPLTICAGNHSGYSLAGLDRQGNSLILHIANIRRYRKCKLIFKDLNNKYLKVPNHILVNENGTFAFVDTFDNTVTVMSHQGEVLFRSAFEPRPEGIVSDGHVTTFVCTPDSNAVTAITTARKPVISGVLNAFQGLLQPTCICLPEKKDCYLVGSGDGKLRSFKLIFRPKHYDSAL